jgi:hypothetical protein
MISLRTTILVIAVFCAGSVQADEAALSKQLGVKDGWVAYTVPMIEGHGSPCCNDGSATRGACDLDRRDGNFTSNGDRSEASDQLSVYWHIADGRADKLRAFAASCEVSSRQDIRWIESVEASDSVALISDWIGKYAQQKDRANQELVTLAYHADTRATSALVELAATQQPRALREQSIFWLGHARGAEGAQIVERFATTDADPKLRAQAVFVLSQSSVDDPYSRIRAISQRDADTYVRSQALFWMAQMKDPRAAADITRILSSESSAKVREEAVFALSQLDTEVAAAALIALVRSDQPRAVKEKALFWLGQSDSDQATGFLDATLAKAPLPGS